MNEVMSKKEKGEMREKNKEEKSMEVEMENFEEKVMKKRGRRPKGSHEEIQEIKEQNKFFIDVSKDHESRDLIINLLAQANNKTYGKEIMLKDLLISVLPKITNKDIDKIQENSLDEMEKVERARDEYNKKNNSSLSLGEFLVMKLGINKEGRNV
jgi:hypothetical protein